MGGWPVLDVMGKHTGRGRWGTWSDDATSRGRHRGGGRAAITLVARSILCDANVSIALFPVMERLIWRHRECDGDRRRVSPGGGNSPSKRSPLAFS